MFDGLPQKHETKPDVFSIEAIIAWLERAEPTYCYEYTDPLTCLLGVYVSEHHGACSGISYILGDREIGVCAPGLGNSMPEFLHAIAYPRPWTLGAALERAKKLLASR